MQVFSCSANTVNLFSNTGITLFAEQNFLTFLLVFILVSGKLLRLDAKGANVPVLVVSARSGHQDQLGTLQLGANAYICKPFSPRELVRQVRQLLETSAAETNA